METKLYFRTVKPLRKMDGKLLDIIMSEFFHKFVILNGTAYGVFCFEKRRDVNKVIAQLNVEVIECLTEPKGYGYKMV